MPVGKSPAGQERFHENTNRPEEESENSPFNLTPAILNRDP